MGWNSGQALNPRPDHNRTPHEVSKIDLFINCILNQFKCSTVEVPSKWSNDQ